MNLRTCAVITLDERGGGVAAVSRLVWRAFRERWGSDAHLVTLRPRVGDGLGASAELQVRLTFGAKLAGAQAVGGSRWIFYTHLALAQVQRYVPARLHSPYAVFLHGIEAWRPLTKTQRGVLEGARLLVANSAYTAGRVADAHPWIGPMSVCSLALEEDRRIGHDEMSGSAAEQMRPTVIIVGRLAAAERYKGHDQILEAWPEVRRRCPDARLVVVGEGDDRARLEAKAHALCPGSSIEFTGFVTPERLRSLYGQASVFAMPSRNEGFGLVYLEAMSHQLPCIGSLHDAAREVIQDGVTGYLVDQADLANLSERLVHVLMDRDLRVEMGRAGLRRLTDRYSYDGFRDRLMALIDGAFGESTEPVVASAGGRATREG